MEQSGSNNTNAIVEEIQTEQLSEEQSSLSSSQEAADAAPKTSNALEDKATTSFSEANTLDIPQDFSLQPLINIRTSVHSRIIRQLNDDGLKRLHDVKSQIIVEQSCSKDISTVGEAIQTVSEQQGTADVNVRIVQTAPRFTANTDVAKNSTLQPLMIRSSIQSPLESQPRLQPSALPSPFSLVTAAQPPSLFLQALAKLNEGPVSMSVINKMMETRLRNAIASKQSAEISPPDSLTSAPPSYSFVLRQMASRRRPRLMGTFIPSPSFVQHTPPPNYATAFDIYVDNSVPPPPRVYHFGFAPMPAVCHECGFTGMTVVTTKITACTHMCAFILCIFCCWICVPLPYILRSCKDVYHHCRACRSYLGMYCPTVPDNSTYA